MNRRTMVRVGYAGGLMWMISWIVDSLAGGHVYQAADGMVVGDPGTISPEYTVTVLELPVRNGDWVKRGDVVARVSSSRVAEATANLSAQSSTLVTRMAEITSKAGMIDQLVSGAEARDRTVEANSKQLQIVRDKKLLPLLTDNAVAEQVFRGKQELAVLRAERDSMAQQVAQVIAASRFTDQALEDLQTLFDAGRMRAPMDGFIAGFEVGVGSVVRTGDVLAEMVGEQRYVLAYYPTNRTYEVKVDAPVTIDVGLGNWLKGKIKRVEPIVVRLPKEFQRTLSPVQRQQLVRIEFDDGVVPPPYFTKVTVRTGFMQ